MMRPRCPRLTETARVAHERHRRQQQGEARSLVYGRGHTQACDVGLAPPGNSAVAAVLVACTRGSEARCHLSSGDECRLRVGRIASASTRSSLVASPANRLKGSEPAGHTGEGAQRRGDTDDLRSGLGAVTRGSRKPLLLVRRRRRCASARSRADASAPARPCWVAAGSIGTVRRRCSSSLPRHSGRE
jgi:hypothetical protein